MKTLTIHNRPISWFSPFIELNDMFEPFFSSVEPVAENVSETPHSYNLRFSVPEFRKKDLHINLDNGELVIKGQRKTSSGVFRKGKKAYSTSFERRFTISKDMDVDNIKAKFKKGELKLFIPKKNEFIKYREIPVEGSSIPVKENKEPINVKGNFIDSIKQKIQKAFNRAA